METPNWFSMKICMCGGVCYVNDGTKGLVCVLILLVLSRYLAVNILSSSNSMLYYKSFLWLMLLNCFPVIYSVPQCIYE